MADDFAANIATTGRVRLDNGFVSGNLEVAGDHDWFRIWLWEGHTYAVQQLGVPSGIGTLPDPFVRLRDGAGNFLVGNDDGGINGFESYLRYVAPTSGFYYVDAGAFADGGTGTYKLSVTQQADHLGAANHWGTGALATDRVADFSNVVGGLRQDDLLQIYNGSIYVATAGETGFSTYQLWGTGATASDQIGDFNNDGRNDLLQIYNNNAYVSLSNGTAFNAFTNWHTGGVLANATHADVNADGLSDLVQITSTGAVQVALSNGANAFGAFVTSNIGATQADRISSGPGSSIINISNGNTNGYLSTDFNNDGRADIFELYNGQAYVALASSVTAGQFNAFTLWGTGTTASDRVADFNADGRADIAQIYNGTVYVALSNGAAFGPWSQWATGATESDQFRDMNGDGRADLYQVYQGRSYVALSEGGNANGFTDWDIWAIGVSGNERFGDVSGDGLTDLVQIEATGVVDVYASQHVPGSDQFIFMV